MSFIITCLVFAAIGFVLRAMSSQQQQQNYRPSQFMQQPNYLGTALAVGAGVVAGNMVADAMASDDEPADHGEEPVVEDQPVVEDEPVIEDWDMGGFEI